MSAAHRTRNKKGEYLEPEQQLLKLAEQRASAVRALLLDAGVAEERLRNCHPATDADARGKLRVEIRL